VATTTTTTTTTSAIPSLRSTAKTPRTPEEGLRITFFLACSASWRFNSGD